MILSIDKYVFHSCTWWHVIPRSAYPTGRLSEAVECAADERGEGPMSDADTEAQRIMMEDLAFRL